MSIRQLRTRGVFSLALVSGATGAVLVPGTSDAATIDVLVIYTQGVENKYGGDPLTRFNHLFNVSNQVYVDSDIDLSLRVAGAVKVDYPDSGTANLALDDVTYGRSVFANVETLRAQYNADMVLFYRVYQSSHGSCGLAWVNAGSKGNLSDDNSKNYMYAHVSIDTCPDHTTVHELGHNMGLNHSRLQDKTGGAFSYALGYGVAGKFTDIMAYTSSFKVDYWTGTVYKLSNPLVTCRGLPCGVDRSKSNGADAAFALNLTGPQIANYYGGSNTALRSELSLTADRLAQAEALRNEAIAVRDAQLILSNQAATDLTRAKAAVDAINKRGGKAFTTYQTKMASLTKENATLATLATRLQSAQAKYNAARTDAARKAAAKALATARSNYDKQATKLQKLQAEVDTLSTQFASLASELTAATDALIAMTAVAKQEKARYDAALAAAKNAEANYQLIKANYQSLKAEYAKL